MRTPKIFCGRNNSIHVTAFDWNEEDEIKKAIPHDVLFLKRKRYDDHSSDAKSHYVVENDINFTPFQFLPRNNGKNDSTLHKKKNRTQFSRINDILNKMQLT